MTERGLPSVDGSPACPFVAFEDERDERADRPDHRHRCYAESEPAPRALAHQEAYCLSSAFPVCPTFQEWARREAAHARAGGTAAPTPAGATVSAADPGEPAGDARTQDLGAAPTDDDSRYRRRDERPSEQGPRRNPPRDWAAPPPWASGAGAGGLAGAAGGAAAAGSAGSGAAGAGSPDFLGRKSEGSGLAGSAADRLARGGHIADDPDIEVEPHVRAPSDHPSNEGDPELAGLVGSSGRGGVRDARDGLPPVARSNRLPTVSSTRDRDRERERELERERERGHTADGPEWEGQRRYEAYPQLKARASMPGMPGRPRLLVFASALAVAALVLFFLPDLLGIFSGDDSPRPTATPTAAVATPTPEPTPVPAPTPQVYVIKEGDTLSKIARSFGLTLEELLAANTETIENPDRITVGDEIIIPIPVPDEVGGGSASESPAP